MAPQGRRQTLGKSVSLSVPWLQEETWWRPLQGHLGGSQGPYEKDLGTPLTFSADLHPDTSLPASLPHSDVLRLASIKAYE